jgi:hypothetical protein
MSAKTFEEARVARERAQALKDSVDAAKRAAALKNPEADTFAENARAAVAAGWRRTNVSR